MSSIRTFAFSICCFAQLTTTAIASCEETGIHVCGAAQEVTKDFSSQFEYVESKLGIDYRKMAPSPLAEMLSQGEVEFRNSATLKFAEKTPRYWKGISKSVSKGNISKSMIGRLREYTPLMLQQFAVGLNPQDPKYGGLWSVGTNYIARKLAGTKT